MFFEKYKSHYSLNFFAACGWINLIEFLSFVIPSFFIESDSIDAIIPSIISLNWFFVVYATITFFIFMLETFYEFKITSSSILNNKTINTLRILGTILATLPFLALFTAFLFLKY